MAFTPCAAVAALLATGIAVALRNWAAAAAAALATVCLGAAVLPRAVGSELEDPAGHQTVTVLAANIHHGTADPAALVALVERLRPDLLSVEELTPRFARELRAEGIDRLLPESHLAVHTNVSGSGLYARHPLRAMPEPARFQFRMPRALMALPGGRSLRVVGVHPYPPLRGRVGEWSAALGSLPTAGAGVPWVLPGDFNATLDHAELRDLLGRGYGDAADVAGEGLEPTWPRGPHDAAADRDRPRPRRPPPRRRRLRGRWISRGATTARSTPGWCCPRPPQPTCLTRRSSSRCRRRGPPRAGRREPWSRRPSRRASPRRSGGRRRAR